MSQRNIERLFHSLNRGPLMPIGGAEDKGSDGEIHQRFIKEAGGKKARIVIIPTASNEQEKMGQRYEEVFSQHGAGQVKTLMIENREESNSQSAIELVNWGNAFFITGGAQEKLVSLLVGTLTLEMLRQRNAEGAIVAGTSAGASILPHNSLVGGTGIGGNSNESAARKGQVEQVGGFGLIRDVIIDQHFSQRGRIGRLLAIFAGSPGLIGIGLDEDTAALITSDSQLEAIGTGMVTIIDGRNTVSDYAHRKMGEVLTVAQSSLHVLGAGRRFDLVKRRVIDL